MNKAQQILNSCRPLEEYFDPFTGEMHTDPSATPHSGKPEEDILMQDPQYRHLMQQYQLAYGKNSHQPHMAAEQRYIDHIRQKELLKQFKEANPTVLGKLKLAMTERDWTKLTGLLGKGALWAAVVHAYPYVALPYFVLNAYNLHHDRQRVRQEWGVQPRKYLNLRDPHVRTNWRDVKNAFLNRKEGPAHEW